MSQEIIALNQKLLESIVRGDWAAYAAMCDDSITCFEAEARGELVAGMPFHKFYFELGGAPAKKQVTMCSPHVRLLGSEGAVICYVRLTQYIDAAGSPQTSRIEETRVWQKIGGQWKHVHFHRSANS
jgi:calcium/calmodulin-dependent protein kinase (CaM kinase) II